MRYVRFTPALLALAAIALAVAFFANSASAETITVTREDDPAPDGCATNGCTFREATDLGNTTPGNQIIDIGDKEIVLDSTINITGDMTITGVNTTDSIIRTSAGAQIFNIAASGNATFTKVWIQSAITAGPGGCGGAVYNAGTVYLTIRRSARTTSLARAPGSVMSARRSWMTRICSQTAR